MSATSHDQVEVRFHASAEHVAVIDAIGIAQGMDRTAVMRVLLAEAFEKEIHRATLICRVARINPLARDDDGKGDGR